MEAGVIGATVETLRRHLEAAAGRRLQLLVVDDGSTDPTAAQARAAGAEVLVLPHRGKGSAVRAGMLAARAPIVAFCDADLAYSPEQVLKLCALVESGRADVAVGSRRHVDAVTLVRSGRLREVSGRVFSAITDAVVVGARHDTQCGVKAFSAEAAAAIFGRTRVDGFAFDVEVFLLADRLGYRVVDVPVELANSPRSSVRVRRQALLMLRDVARIRWWDARGAYRLPEGIPAPGSG